VVNRGPRKALEQDRWYDTMDGLYSFCWGAQDMKPHLQLLHGCITLLARRLKDSYWVLIHSTVGDKNCMIMIANLILLYACVLWSCMCKKIEILKVSKLESSLVHAETRSPTNINTCYFTGFKNMVPLKKMKQMKNPSENIERFISVSLSVLTK